MSQPPGSGLIADLLTLADSMDADSYPGSDIVRAAAELLRWSISLHEDSYPSVTDEER